VEDQDQFIKNLDFAECASERWPWRENFQELKKQAGKEGSNDVE